MADYYPLIARAVAGLKENTGDARRALYERARKALSEQLRGMTQTLSEAQTEAERRALEDAIKKAEAEAAARSRGTSAATAAMRSGANDGSKQTKFSVTSTANSVELRIGDACETLEFLDAMELGSQLAVTHSKLVVEKRRGINFAYGTIKTELTGKEIYELALALHTAAIPLGNDAINGGWSSKSGRELLDHITKGAPAMAMAESARASREALNDPATMRGKEHLAADEPYKKFRQAVDSVRSKGRTNNDSDEALLSACQNGQLDAVKKLLSEGANASATGRHGITALIKAISLRHFEIAKELLAHGADVNAANDNEETALLHASRVGHLETVAALLALGANSNAVGNIGGTALMLAAYFGHLDVVKALLAAGADVDVKNVDGTSALFMASANGHLDVAKALLSHGADANTTMNDGYTALMRASQDGRLEVVRELLAWNADVDARNLDGNTAISLASSNDVKGLLANATAKTERF